MLGLAVAVRAAVWLSFPGIFDFVATGTVHGSEAYDAYAVNLLSTGVYGRDAGVPDAALPPLYSLLLSAIYFVAGRSALAVAAVHTACDLASMVFLRRIASALGCAPPAGTLAALGMAIYPYLVFQSLTVNDTSFFILQLHAFTWLAVRLGHPDRRTGVVWWVVAGGVVLGLATLTRPVILPLLGWVVLWWTLRLPVRDVALRTVAIAASATLVIGAWAARNARVYDETVVIATNGGSNFWQGNNPRAHAYLAAGYDVQWISPGPLGGIDFRDPAANREFMAEGLRFWRDHPGEIPALLWTKFLVHWSIDVTPRRQPASDAAVTPRGEDVRQVAQGDTVALSGLGPGHAVSAYAEPLFDRYGRLVHRTFWGLSLLLAFVGVWATRRGWRDVSLLWCVQINMTLAYMVFHPSTRYRLPSDPLLMVFSAAGIVVLVAWAVRAARRVRPVR